MLKRNVPPSRAVWPAGCAAAVGAAAGFAAGAAVGAGGGGVAVGATAALVGPGAGGTAAGPHAASSEAPSPATPQEIRNPRRLQRRRTGVGDAPAASRTANPPSSADPRPTLVAGALLSYPPPTGYVDHLCAHKARFVADQKTDDAGDVLRLAGAAERGTRRRILFELLPVQAHPFGRLLGHARLDEAGRNGVDVDIERPELDRQRARQAL